jgi:tripartite-type tricarboxylate transporter receptor subunit TctC
MQELAEHAKSNGVVLGHFGAPLVPTKVTKALAKSLGFSYASDSAFDALDCNTLASGDVDVMNTTIQLVLPCLDKVTVLAAVTAERISKVPDAPTVGEIDPALNIALWNGLFVHKDTPQDIRDKIAAVAQKTIAGDRAKAFAEETGAQIYWQDATASKAQIESDIEAIAKLNQMLE